MSIVLPILVLLLITGIAAYHRFSLAVFTAIAATALVAVGIFGGNFTATVIWCPAGTVHAAFVADTFPSAIHHQTFARFLYQDSATAFGYRESGA